MLLGVCKAAVARLITQPSGRRRLLPTTLKPTTRACAALTPKKLTPTAKKLTPQGIWLRRTQHAIEIPGWDDPRRSGVG
jgi:hypothetical protein